MVRSNDKGYLEDIRLESEFVEMKRRNVSINIAFVEMKARYVSMKQPFNETNGDFVLLNPFRIETNIDYVSMARCSLLNRKHILPFKGIFNKIDLIPCVLRNVILYT